MSFCLPRIQPYVFMYGIKKYVFLSFCLQNMALGNTSFCHSVYRRSRSFNALFATVSSSSPSSQKLNTQLYAACFSGRLSPCSRHMSLIKELIDASFVRFKTLSKQSSKQLIATKLIHILIRSNPLICQRGCKTEVCNRWKAGSSAISCVRTRSIHTSTRSLSIRSAGIISVANT